MKRTLSILLAVCLMLSAVSLLAGCSKTGGGSGYPVTVGGVTIDKEPANIVVLNDDLADIVSYLGYDVKMVGRSAECDQDFLYVVPVMGSAASPDVNAITAAKADLVIADSTLNNNSKSALESAGVKVLTLESAKNEEDLRNLYISLGTALGGSEKGAVKGQEGYDALFTMLDKLNTASSSVVQTAAYLYLDGSGQLCTFVKGSLEYSIFNFNGCTNVLLNQTQPAVNPDELQKGSPAYVFYDSPAVLDYLKASPQLSNINGLVNGHTLQIPLKQFMRHGSTAEQTVFEMLNYIEKVTKSTPDQATVAPTKAAAAPTKAPATAEPETAEPVTEAPEVTEAQAEDVAVNEADNGNVVY